MFFREQEKLCFSKFSNKNFAVICSGIKVPDTFNFKEVENLKGFQTFTIHIVSGVEVFANVK
ncbi:hypothetical protein CMI42_01045 [Candidatus Pacearchaeota archaeon]|nr:hypothetical protein [Candidatus Pacearchaeota archaeon]